MTSITRLAGALLALATVPAAAAPSGFLSPAQADAATHHGALHRGGQLPAGTANLAQGFNSFHATTCVNYSSGYTFVYPQEGGYIFTNVPANIFLLGAACAQGNLVAVNVYDQYGDWNQLYAYSHK